MRNFRIVITSRRYLITEDSVVISASSARDALDFYADAMDYGTFVEMVANLASVKSTVAAVATDDPARYTACTRKEQTAEQAIEGADEEHLHGIRTITTDYSESDDEYLAYAAEFEMPPC